MDFQLLGDYINGQFSSPKDPIGEFTRKSPADFEDTIGSFRYSFNSVDKAVEAARKAFKSWQLTTIEERKNLLKKFKTQLKRRRPLLEKIICREVGKPAWEAKGEVDAMISKFDITLTAGMKVIAPFEVPNGYKKTAGRCRYKPRGVLAVLGPFNFPASLPHDHIVAALLTGNCVVFKPSEYTPATGQVYTEIAHQAGFPRGVINLVQGGARVGSHLAKHTDIDGILFTGSYETGIKIQKETLNDYWKILALEMGGKNSAIILADADIDKALIECLNGAFLTTGQRCSSTSRLIIDRKISNQFIERFHDLAKKVVIDHPHADQQGRKTPFMGPLISARAKEKYLKFQDIATREKAERIMRAKPLERDPEGHYVAPSIYLVKKPDLESIYQQTEIFGPNVAIYLVDGAEEAIEIANKTSFGLVLSAFTQSEKIFEKIFTLSRTGLVNWNLSTVCSSQRLPFGGVKKSGNARPAGLFSTQYCTYPVAELRDSEPFDSQNLPPGVIWG
ncbi:aldehyde dehydrogenase family protein [Bdellovibrionota bacterium]